MKLPYRSSALLLDQTHSPYDMRRQGDGFPPGFGRTAFGLMIPT
jgi:hypothetical protein